MNSDHVFLARVLPWADGSPWFNLHYFDDKKFVQSRAYKTVEEMVRGLEWIKRQTYVRDIYCCMSSQTVSEQKSTANGFTYYKGVRSKEGAFELKSLFLDIDVKKGAYDDTAACAAALGKFIRASGMPRPTLAVETGGGGVHVHWVLDRALKVADWLLLANALKNATKQHGLITDEGVTADAARILRVPDTVNWKYPNHPVASLGASILPTDYPVAMIEKILAPYTKAAPPPPPPPGGATVHPFPPGLNSDLTAGVGGDGTFVFDEYEDAAKFLLGKGVFAREKDGGSYKSLIDFLFATAWAATAYPVLADKLEQLFKDISGAVPDRDPAIADKRWATEMARMPGLLVAGAPLVKPATIFKLAIDLGWTKPKPQAPPPGVTNDLPPGYTRQADGTIWGSREDKRSGLSTPTQVSPHPMDQAWLSDEPALNFITTVRKQPRAIHLLTKDAVSKDRMNTALATQGFMVPTKKVDVFQEFIVAWVTQLQTLNHVSHAPAFGWAQGGGFAFAGKVHGTNANAGRADDVIARNYDPAGDLQPWKKVAEHIIKAQRHDLNAIIASAFAAPLVKFTGQEGLMMSACSQESGIGKTVALRIAASIWGHPIHSAQTLDDTQNAVIRKLGEVRHLPVYWDEIKSEDQAEKFVNIAFMLSGGREKSRLTQNAASRTFGSWETMLVACSNDSIAETIASVQKSSTAGAMRLFEIKVTPPAQEPTDAVAVSRMINDLKDNHGHAGLEYAAYLGSNKVAIEKRVQTTLENMVAKWAVPAEERFWAAVVASLVVGAAIANHLALTTIDEQGLLVFLRGQWAAMRTSSTISDSDLRNVNNLSSVLGRFLRDMRIGYTLHTDRIWAGQGRPKNGDVKVIQNTNTLREVKVQIGKQDKRLRVSANDMAEWMRRQKLSAQAFNAHFAKAFKMTLTKTCIGSGTDYATGQMKCYDFDLSDPAMASFFDGIDLS